MLTWARVLRHRKAVRHAFAIDAVQNSVALNIVQSWLGHERIETASIHADAVGEEERELASRTWKCFGETIFNSSVERVEQAMHPF